MKLLGLDHIGIVVRDINETIARAGDTVDGRALGERILAGDVDLQFLLCGETRLELIEVRAAGFGVSSTSTAQTCPAYGPGGAEGQCTSASATCGIPTLGGGRAARMRLNRSEWRGGGRRGRLLGAEKAPPGRRSRTTRVASWVS